MTIADASPLSGISSMAMRQVLAELAGDYERRCRRPVVIEAVGGVDAARRVRAGEPFDFVVLAADAIDALASAGLVDPHTRTALARSGVAIAVKAGATHPDVASEEAVRDAVLRARRIGYSTGPSGVHLARLFERWGIADAIATRLVQAPAGVPVATLIERGDVELGFQQLSELIDSPGVGVVGPLPPEIQATTIFTAAVCRASTQPQAARALLAFLASSEGDAAKRRRGMEPANPRKPDGTVAARTVS